MKKAIKIISFIIFNCACVNITQAQLRYDANWVFGYKGGLYFNNLNIDPEPFKSNCMNNELCGSISDINGNLIFYISHSFDNSNVSFYSNINSKDGSKVLDSLLVNSTCTNCVVIIPNSVNNDSIFHIFHIGQNETLLNNTFLHSVVKLKNQNYTFIKKNNIIYNGNLDEKISLVRHANGKDWWIILNEFFNTNNPILNNNYVTYLFSDDMLSSPKIQSIGPLKLPNQHTFTGEMSFSREGNKFATPLNNNIAVFDFDRCNGGLIGPIKVFNGNNNLLFNNIFSYSLLFSPNEEYVFVSNNSCPTNCYYSITQYSLSSSNLFTHAIGMYPDTSDIASWQMEMGPNNKIYVSMTDSRYLNNSFPFETSQYLSVINYPDSFGLSANFEKFKLYLGDSSYVSLGLPNFPNYNLGPLSIYEADAGRDTIICTDSTNNQKVVQIGNTKINGVQYQWYPNYNLSSDSVAQPLAYPDSSTWYYVMLSDTTIKNACKTRLDSVLVEVKKCVTSVKNLSLKAVKYEIIPNPSNVEKGGNISIVEQGSGEILLYSIEGKQIAKVAIQTGQNTINFESLGINAGIIIYKVMWNNKLNNTARLVILN
jgi:hypothetical protein